MPIENQIPFSRVNVADLSRLIKPQPPLYRGGQFYWWRKPPTCHKSLTNVFTKCCIALVGIELTILVVIVLIA